MVKYEVDEKITGGNEITVSVDLPDGWVAAYANDGEPDGTSVLDAFATDRIWIGLEYNSDFTSALWHREPHQPRPI